MKISLLTSSSNQFRIRKFVTEGVACQPLARWHATPSITTSLIPNDSKFSRFFDQLKIALQVFVEYLFPSGFFLLRNNLIKKMVKFRIRSFEIGLWIWWTRYMSRWAHPNHQFYQLRRSTFFTNFISYLL